MHFPNTYKRKKMLISLLLLILNWLTFVTCLGNSRLLVVSFDGFRYDYIDRKITPNIHSLKAKSTSAKFLLNIFPTQTYPNHFSIATGLYSENHGVLASEIYDPQTKSILKYGYDLWHYNKSVLPIWTLNEKSGRHSGVMMWPGSNFEYAGINTTYITKYNSSIPWENRVDTVIGWLTNKVKPANLVMMYFEEPDKDSHAYGPDSPQTNVQIKKVDRIIKYISDKLNDPRFKDLNVIFLSDHGMEGVTINRIIDLRPIVGNISDMYGTSPVLQVYPVKGKEEDVYTKLKSFSAQNKHFQVYKRKDIPDDFHYKKCNRAPPILVLAEPKYAFQDLYDGIKWYKEHYSDVTDNNTFGVHGYDPKTIDMHPYFIAYGPLFKDNYEADHLYTVDMYILFAHTLALNPPYTDGDINRVLQVLEKASVNNAAAITVGLVLLLISFGMIIFSVVYIKRKRKKLPVVVTETIFDDKEGVALLEQ